MRAMPPECEMEKELQMNVCFNCKDQCRYGRDIIAAYARHKTDLEYEKMRREYPDG